MEGLQTIKEFFKNQWNKDKKIIVFSIVAGVITTFFWGYSTLGAYSEEIQTGIADKVVRFHILANSDSDSDQNLKLDVRDRILEEMHSDLEQCKDKEETKELLATSFERIKATAIEEIRSQGYGYDVNVSLSKDVFPLKQYGDVTFPAGSYDALRVEIGKAEGHNWWCVMFPPMCFVDAACGEVTEESKLNLAGALTEEEYTVVTAMENNEVSPKIKFKIVEWYQEKKQKKKIS